MEKLDRELRAISNALERVKGVSENKKNYNFIKKLEEMKKEYENKQKLMRNDFIKDDDCDEPTKKLKESEKEKDFGGCRCQAFLLTGDPAATDPVCAKSPNHHVVKLAISEAAAVANADASKEFPLIFRTDANSKRFAG